jgi:hypothetical protein
MKKETETDSRILKLAVKYLPYALFGAILIALGAQMEGSTLEGHHLVLILGGAFIGFGIGREIQK